MDFQSVNHLNVRLNMLSGNLLPVTSDQLFPTAWRIYSVIVWLIKVMQITATISGITCVSSDKAWCDGTVVLLVTVEAFFLTARIRSRGDLVDRLIERLNDILRAQNEIMRAIVESTLESVDKPLKFYWMAGTGSMIVWSCVPLTLIVRRSSFYYEDYRVPAVYSRQPFSTSVFLLGNLTALVAHIFIFMGKVAVDVYMINFVLLMTAQYRYIAEKLATILREETQRDERDECDKSRKGYADVDLQTEMKVLCRHYNAMVHVTSMLKELLSLNFSLIYLCNVFRFCFLCIMLISSMSSTPLEVFMVVMYIMGSLVELYIMCSCVHQLFDASMEITSKAFHEKWYAFGLPLKRTFLLMIIANNLQCKLSTFGKFTLSLPSFMTILNQSYSFTLVFLRMQ